MEIPSINKRIEKKIKEYDPDLFVEWDMDRERWALKRRDLKGDIHHIFFIQNEDGSFRPLDERIMKELYECDLWRHFGRMDCGSEYYKFFTEHNKAVELRHNTIRQEYLKWWNKDNKKEWAKAIDNAKQGILSKESETKFYSIPTK